MKAFFRNIELLCFTLFLCFAVLVGCDSITEDITGTGNQTTEEGGNKTDNDNKDDNKDDPGNGGADTKVTKLQDVINDTTGDTIDLSKYTDLKDFTAKVDKKLTIKNGSLAKGTLTIEVADVVLEGVKDVNIVASSKLKSGKLTVQDSQLTDLSVDGGSLIQVLGKSSVDDITMNYPNTKVLLGNGAKVTNLTLKKYGTIQVEKDGAATIGSLELVGDEEPAVVGGIGNLKIDEIDFIGKNAKLDLGGNIEAGKITVAYQAAINAYEYELKLNKANVTTSNATAALYLIKAELIPDNIGVILPENYKYKIGDTLDKNDIKVAVKNTVELYKNKLWTSIPAEFNEVTDFEVAIKGSDDLVFSTEGEVEIVITYLGVEVSGTILVKGETGKYIPGTGVYELRAKKTDIGSIYDMWNGFTVLLLKDDQVSDYIDPEMVGTLDAPVAQIVPSVESWGNLTFPKYASAVGNAHVTYGDGDINGIWANLTEDEFTIYVDMSKLDSAELKCFGNGISGDGIKTNEFLNLGVNLDLIGYKPYVLAMFDGEEDVSGNKYVGECWQVSVFEMKESTATIPDSFDKFIEEADVSAINAETTAQPGAKFRIEGASFAGASGQDMYFENGVATLEFSVAEGEESIWSIDHFTCWFRFYAGDDETFLQTNRQYYAGETRLGVTTNLTEYRETSGDFEVTDLTSAEAGTYVITVDATGAVPTIKVDRKITE